MELGNIVLEINKLHDTVHLNNVSPAECQVYRQEFGQKIEGNPVPTNPIIYLEITEKASKRTVQADFTRLTRKFGSKKIESMFPGANPNLPETFEKAGFVKDDKGVLFQYEKPKVGVPLEIRPLAEIPKGDSGKDMESEAVNPLEEIVQKQQEQIQQLLDMVKAQASRVQVVPAAPSDSKLEPNKEKAS